MAMNELMVAHALAWQDDRTAAVLHGPMQALSYYKIFGYPTGLGALLARKDALKVLRKRYFGGGAVAVSVADRNFFRCVLKDVFLSRTMHCPWTAAPACYD